LRRCPAGGPYHVFAGKECARALALMKLTEEYVGSDDLEGCSDKDIKILEDWVGACVRQLGCGLRVRCVWAFTFTGLLLPRPSPKSRR